MSAKSDLVAAMASEATGKNREIDRLWSALQSTALQSSIFMEAWREHWLEEQGALRRLHEAQRQLCGVQAKALELDLELAKSRDQVRRLLGELEEAKGRIRELERREPPLEGTVFDWKVEPPAGQAQTPGADGGAGPARPGETCPF